MKPEAQRIAIGKACGWVNQGETKGVPALSHRWANPSRNIGVGDNLLPDYLTDLNAMHEAEKTLNMSQASDYGHALIAVLDRGIELNEDTQIGGIDVYAIAHCPVAIRAEAFLRTLNLWQSPAPAKEKEST